MKTCHKLLAVITLVLVVPISHANSEMRQFIEFFDKNNPEKFQAMLDDFIEKGQAGDVDGMLSITSPNTRRKFGDGQLRTVYRDKFVPLLKSCSSLTKSMNVTAVSEAQTRAGAGYLYEFGCVRDNAPTFRLKSFILWEEGTVVVTSFGPG